MNTSHDSQHEQTFRQGYFRGWQDALNALLCLMRESGIGCDRACEKCWMHHERELEEWRMGDCAQHRDPPTLCLQGTREELEELGISRIHSDPSDPQA